MNVLQGKMTVPSGLNVQTPGRRTRVLVETDLQTTTLKDLEEPVKVRTHSTVMGGLIFTNIM